MARFGLEFVRKLRPVKWKKKIGDSEKIHFGFAVKDVLNLAPIETYSFIREDKEKKSYGIAYHEFIAPIVKAIQEIDYRLRVIEKKLEEGDKDEMV